MTGMVTINSWQFYPDGPLGATLGYNAAHGTDIHFFQDLIAYGGVRVRLNIKPDLYVASSMSASPSTWTWAFVDAVVLMANQNNIRCTLIARGLTPSASFPSWQEASSCAPGFDQTTIPGYTKIAVALARRYSGDGNADNAKDSHGNALQADCIEIGNEEINSMQDSSALPYTGCRKAMRYVKLVRDTLTQLRASSASGGGGWIPRGNFLARVGAWGIVHDQPNEITSTYGILTHPVFDTTYNPSANGSSIFGFDASIGPNGTQLLDYANHHNYNAADGSGGLTPAAETTQIRGILNAAGNTTIPIWVTEAGWPGPCVGTTEAAQSNYYAANPDGSGGGALQSMKDAGVQHFDIFTLNYWDTNKTSGGLYIGQADSIACLTTASNPKPNTYVRFMAHATITNFMTNIDKGAWAAKAVPAGFGNQPTGGPPPGPTLTTVATDTFKNRSVNPGWGAASDGTSGSWVSFTEPASGGTTYLAPTLLKVDTANGAYFDGNNLSSACLLLGSQTLTDGDVTARVTLSVTGENASVVLRSNAAGTIYYRASLSGGILECSYMDPAQTLGRINLYQSASLGLVAGTIYHLRFRIIGTQLQGRYWADGTTEPTDFTNAAYAFTITDTSGTALTSGQFGLRARCTGSSQIINFDSFLASSIGTVTPPPPTTSGALTGAFAPLASTNVNLTTEGTSDWGHWGVTGTTFDHKSSGGSQISDATTLGNASKIQNPSALNTFTYTDGVPNATETATATGIKVAPPVGGGGSTTPHLCVVYLENHAYSQIIGNSNMPHINSLATTYGNCTKFYGVTHQSLANYVAFASGSDQGGVADTYNPASNPLAGSTLFSSLDMAGVAWKHYAENLPSAGYLGGDTGGYVQHHNPAVYFSNFRSATAAYQQAHIVNYSNLSTDLSGGTAPPVLFVQPNNTDNGHSGTDTQLDNFVNSVVPLIQASSWYAAGGMIILWFDESHPDTDVAGIGDPGSNSKYPHGGQTACIVVSAANSGATLATGLNHYGVLRGIEKLYGLPYLLDSNHTINGDLSPLLGTTSGAVTTSNQGNGFKITAPADTNSRTLKIYTDVNQGIATLAASLSDGSAPDFYDSTLQDSSGGAASAGVYTLTYQAAASAQTLAVFYTLSDNKVAGVLNASDSFTRANQANLGTSSDGETYTLVTEVGSPVWAIASNQGKMTGSVGNTGVALLGSHTLQDCESVGIVNVSNGLDSAGLILRSNAAGTIYYLASLNNNDINLIYMNAGVATVLNSQTATFKTNTNYWLRFRIVKSSLYAKFWPNDGTAEPANWSVFASDQTISTAGNFGFRGAIGAASDAVLFDTFSVVDLSATGDPSYVSLYAADLPTGVTTSTGSISVATSTPAGTIDLTATGEGDGDWIKPGYSSASSLDRKANVTQQLSAITNVGSGTYLQNTAALLAWSWEDGTPDTTVVASMTETTVQGVANGWSFTVPADTTPRTLNVYVAAKKAQGTLTATLSDGSFAAYSDTSLNDVSTGTAKKYQITYNAGSASQTLAIKWVMLTDNGAAGSLTTYSTDSFTRADNASSWGSASDGTSGAWVQTIQSGTPTASILSNKGKLTSTNPSNILSLLGTQTQANAEGLVRCSISNLADSFALVLRATSLTTFYRAAVTSGVLTLTRRNAGVDTDLLPTATITTAINTLYWLRFRVNGSNLYARFWADGASEPTGWTLTYSDTGTSAIAGAGQWGLRTKSTSGDSILYDSYSVTNFGASGGTPGNIALDAASMPLVIGGPPPPPPPPPPSVNTTITVNTTDKVVPNTWQGLGVQQDPYTQGTWILNGSFEDTGGTPWYTPWSFQVTSPAVATISKDTAVFQDGLSSAKITITTAAPGSNYYVQLLQIPVSLLTGSTYTITFYAKADSSRSIDIILQQTMGGYAVYSATTQAITTTWTQYTITYVSTVTDSTAQVAFNLAATTGNVWIDAVTLNAIAISSVQRALINTRLGELNPSIIRTCADAVSWWCPGGVAGTYDFYNPLMQEWYAVFQNAQNNGINVIVGVNSPAPFTTLSPSWCTAFADLVDQLINNLGFTCIKYVSGLSEPELH